MRKIKPLVAIICFASCGQEGWDYGPGPYDTETQVKAVGAILRLYSEYLGDEPIDDVRQRHLTFRWVDQPIECWPGVYCDGTINPNSFTLTMLVLGECIADTSLAHELYHAVAFASCKVDDSIDQDDDDGAYQRALARLASDAARDAACLEVTP